jgi:c-di-GMP-binding flagellar brake protein YcgR
MTMQNQLSPIRRADVIIGKPLPWPVYDSNRKLLLCAGFVIESYKQVERLLEAGLFRIITPGSIRPPSQETAQEETAPETSGSYGGIKPTGQSFTDARLPIGTTIQITNTLADNAGREAVRLIGSYERKSLIVSHPMRDGQLMFVKEGTSYRCRAFAGKNAHAFEATVLKAALVPYPYLHLTYPAVVHTNIVRHAARVATEIVATAEASGSGKTVTTTIKDLSATGALLQSNQILTAAEGEIRVAFRLSLDGSPVLFEINAEVRSTQEAEDGNKNVIRTGIRFLELEPTKKRDLEFYIYQQLANLA